MDSLYVIDVPQKELIPLYDDIARMIIIQISIQILLYSTDPSQTQFFSGEFFLLTLYIVLGVTLYWLVFKKLVIFK